MSSSGALFPPSLPLARRAAAASARRFAPPPRSSFRTWRGRTGLVPERELARRRFGAGAGAGGITEIDESQFSETVLQSDRPVLVEFVANWCGPCRLISPAMEWLAQVFNSSPITSLSLSPAIRFRSSWISLGFILIVLQYLRASVYVQYRAFDFSSRF